MAFSKMGLQFTRLCLTKKNGDFCISAEKPLLACRDFYWYQYFNTISILLLRIFDEMEDGDKTRL